ncbi:MAG: nitrilase-related carbon-nitrogen hydrolase [Planctomycetota bacterium]
MKAHLVQMNLAWEDRRENFARCDRLLRAAPIEEGDLVLLPEMFDSGFSLNTEVTADRRGETDTYLAELADDLGVTVQGGRTVRSCDCDKATNHATVWGPGHARLADYAKIHPFSFGREPEAFRGGDEIALFDWVSGNNALRVCPAVCYDLRFPELFRMGLSRGAEVFAIGANWPAARAGHWRALAIARAIENQAYVVAVNRCGSDPHLDYAGGTIAVDPKGEVIGELGGDEQVLSVDVNPELIRSWRRAFGAWSDMKLLGLTPPEIPDTEHGAAGERS